MSLGAKVEFILFVVLAIVLGLGYVIQRFFVFPGIEVLEDELVLDELNVGVGALDDRLERLTSLGADWARVEPDLLVRRLSNDHIRVLGERELSFAGVYENAEARQTWTRNASTNRPIADFNVDPTALISSRETRTGVLFSSAGPMMTCAYPLTGPSETHLIVGRLLNRGLLDEIYFDSNVVLHAWLENAAELPGSAEQHTKRLTAGLATNTIARESGRVSAYRLYPAVGGNVILRADVNRATVEQAYDAMQRGLLVQLAVGMLGFAALVSLFRRSVMEPLSQLTQHTVEISEFDDLEKRIRMNRDDEIGVLADEFDQMVDRLEKDIEARQSAEEALRESEERYALAVDGANDGIWDWNVDTGTVIYSERWKQLLGFERDEIGDSPEEWLDRIHPDDRENVDTVLEAHRNGQSLHFESEHRLKDTDGVYRWMLFRGIAVYDENNRATRMCGSMSDVTLRREYEDQLKHQSLHDNLTELPNRALLIDRLSQSIRRAQRDSEFLFALIFLDLDRFKVVNDGLGHVIGDKLLTEFAGRLAVSVRDQDTITRTSGSTLARFGGDEFVLLLDDLGEASNAVRVAERIQASLRDPFLIEDHEIYMTASVGIVLSDREIVSPEEFVRNADTAMYRAKARGKNRYEIFDQDMHTRAIERLELENDLRKAIADGDLEVYYQPIVCLKTGRIKAFEALSRWNHPTRGFISPAEFVPIAEETGLIIPLGQWIMRTACEQAREWQRQFPECADLDMSVNLSPREFGNAQLVAGIEDTLVRAKFESRHLKVEITESSLSESLDTVGDILNRIRGLGAQLSIDDFGTGHSSLSHLHRFPMNNLKIDQAFVRDMHSSDESMQIVKTIALLAHALNMAIIAEGIEEESHIRVLQEMECEFGQGFFFSKPVDAERATELLAQQEPDWAAVLRQDKTGN